MSLRVLLMVMALTMTLDHGAQGADRDTTGGAGAQFRQGAKTMNIRLTINGKSATATLLDNATSRDFLSLLPMTLTLEDYAATEKVGYPPRKLSTAGAPAGIDPAVGDIAYYAPWGNLAIFYKDFGYSRGLVRLGRIESGLEALSVPGRLKATIEPID